MNGIEFLVPIVLFVSIAGVLVLRGPIGKAIGDRIAGRSIRPGATGQDTHELARELEEIRYRVAEMEERMDFTERMLTRGRRADGGGER